MFDSTKMMINIGFLGYIVMLVGLVAGTFVVGSPDIVKLGVTVTLTWAAFGVGQFKTEAINELLVAEHEVNNLKQKLARKR